MDFVWDCYELVVLGMGLFGGFVGVVFGGLIGSLMTNDVVWFGSDLIYMWLLLVLMKL